MLAELRIIGNVGRVDQMRYLDSGLAVFSFTVAASRTGKNKEKETTWFRVSVFDKQAETCNQYLTVGRQVYVEGRLAPDAATGGPKTYQKKDGTVGANYDVVANRVLFLGAKPEDSVSIGKQEKVDTDDVPF
jgi:single-strand DNA-binding protein